MEFVGLTTDHIPKMHHLIGKSMVLSGIDAVSVSAMEQWISDALKKGEVFGIVVLDPEPIAFVLAEFTDHPYGQAIHIIHWYTEKPGIGTEMMGRMIQFGISVDAVNVSGIISTKEAVKAARRFGAVTYGIAMSVDLRSVRNSDTAQVEEK